MLRTCFPNDRAGIATGSSCCRDVSIIYVWLLVGRERKHGRDAGALDRVLEFALMQRTGSGDAARKDLPALRDELLQGLDVFVVDVLELLDAELADALAAKEELLLAALRSARSAGAAAATGIAATAATTRSSHFSCHVGLLSLFSRRRFFGRGRFHGLGRSRVRSRRAGRERRGRAQAFLLRIALGELLGALVVEIRAHDHVPQDPGRGFPPPVELIEPGLGLEHQELVVAFVELLDGIRETATTPRFFMRELRACPLGDTLELCRKRGRLFLRYLRRKDEQDFISPHKSSFWPSGASPSSMAQGAAHVVKRISGRGWTGPARIRKEGGGGNYFTSNTAQTSSRTAVRSPSHGSGPPGSGR